MTHSLYRRDSMFMRVMSAFVAMTFTLSLAGSGFAAPPVSESNSNESVPVAEVPVPDVGTPDEGKTSSDPAPDPSVEAAPTTTEPESGDAQEGSADTSTGSGDEPQAPAAVLRMAPMSALSVLSTAPYAGFTSADWEAWRVSPASQVGWQKSNLGEYKEGDWIPVRIVVDNTGGAGDLRFPGFKTAWDYLDTGKNAIAVDGARDFRFFATPGSTLTNAVPYPAGSQDISSYFSEYVGPGTQYYNVEMSTPSSDLVIPKGSYGVVYFQVHLALTPYWQSRPTPRFGAMEYPGSSAQGRFITWNGDGVGQNTISVPVGKQAAPKGEIRGVKFHDINRDGVKQTNEPGLSGWQFTLNYLGEFPFTATATSGAGGAFTFTGLLAGDYSLNETLQTPWTNSTPLPMSLSLARDEVRNIVVGNYVPDVIKTWSLSIDAVPVGGVPFVRYSVNGAPAVTTNLIGSGPYTASVSVPMGASITNISWFVSYGGADVLLGTSPNETLNANRTNSFTYDSSVSGRKFDSASSAGLPGWDIVLKRVVGSVETTYAQVVTGAGGAYSFAGVIPGSYKVYEVQKSGWLALVEPTGSFSVANGSNITGKDFGNLFITSALTIDKSGPALAHVGDVITYRIEVTNSGNYALTNVVVTDPLLGLNRNLGTLASGASQTINATRTVLAGDPDPLPNTARVDGTPIIGAPIFAQDGHSVDILKPAISVKKTAAPTRAVNPADVEYTYVVTNSGQDTLYDVTLSDDKLAVPGAAIGTMAPGQTVTLTAEAVLTTTTTNVATVRGDDALALRVTDRDEAMVQVFNPALSIVKSASSGVVLPGGEVIYTYLVKNEGDIALFGIEVTDDKLGPVGVIPALAPGASDTVSITTNLAEDTTNVGAATGWYGTPETEFYGSVTDSSEASVRVVSPKVEIDKQGSPNPTIKGGMVTYTYVVENVGDVVLYDLVVTDDKLGGIGTIPMLGVGQSSTLTAGVALFDTTENLGEVTGRDQYQHRVSDSDSATVEVFDPRIRIEKTVDRERVVVGDTVVYTYTIENTGDIMLHDVVVTDDILGEIGTIEHLMPGAPTQLTKSAVISGDVTNIGTVEASYGTEETDFAGSVLATDPASVDALSPSFTVEKSASPSPVVSGSTVEYTFTVTNTGDAPLYSLMVHDDKLGHIGTIDELPVGGEPVTLTKSAVLDETTTNVVTVTGYDEFENEYSETDTVTVQVFNPGISILKSASSNVVLSGTPVTYTFLVKNEGDIALFNIAVTDDILGPVGTIPALAPGASDTVSIIQAIAADVTNIGTATGWYGTPETEFYGSVDSSEPEFVDVVAPAIGVVKTVSPTEIVLGESVVYTYVVSNLGDVDLFNVALTDDKLGVVGTLASLPIEGEPVTFTMTASPAEPTTNVVVATAVDAAGHEVRGEDDAFVDVALPFTPKPDMSIEKSANKTRAIAGDTVIYTVTYENVGDGDASGITIVDDFDERYVTVTNAGGGSVAGGRITWEVAGPLSPEAGPQEFTYSVRIDSDLPDSVTRIDNVVVVTTPGDDNSTNDRDDWRVQTGEPFLPFTGGEWTLLALAALAAGALGVALRRLGRSFVS